MTYIRPIEGLPICTTASLLEIVLSKNADRIAIIIQSN